VKVAVVTATKRFGGLDVTYEALRRQTYKDFVWILMDELYYDRRYLVADKAKDLSVHMLEPHPRPGYYSNLPAIYNRAGRLAKNIGCELIVSLQDYITIPSDGIEKFVDLQKSSESPRLFTGLCSMMASPGANSVYDPRGLWTVFHDPYYPETWATTVEWPDVRGGMYPELMECSPIAWEMNWAAYPVGLPPFDESYGEHIGHENQQFAWQAFLKADVRSYIDPTNHAYSLPHRHYFPDEWAEQQGHREKNMTLHKERYGSVEALAAGEHQG
jgi:hypothetical protein